MNNQPQFNIKIPDEIAYNRMSNKYSDKVKALDTYKLLQYENRNLLEAIFGTIDTIVGDAPIQLIQHEPMTGHLDHYEPFKIGHMLSLQNQIPYSMIDSISIAGMDERAQEKTRKALQEKNVSFEDLVKAIDSKLIPRIRAETLPEVKEYISKIAQDNIIPVHFSVYQIDFITNHSNLGLEKMELQGLHIHLYSNHIVEEDFKRNGSYNKVNSVLNLPWADKQKNMLEHSIKKLPNADLKFLKDPNDEFNTILAYYVK